MGRELQGVGDEESSGDIWQGQLHSSVNALVATGLHTKMGKTVHCMCVLPEFARITTLSCKLGMFVQRRRDSDSCRIYKNH